jgi:transcriptional antiterminator NusG
MRLLEARMRMDHKDEEDVEKAKEEIPLYDSTKSYTINDQIKISQTSLPKEEAILNMNNTEKILAKFCFFTVQKPIKVDPKDEKNVGKTEMEQDVLGLLPPPKIAANGKHSTDDPIWAENYTAYPRVKDIQSVFWVSDLKGYVVVEAVNPSDAYLAVEGVRHIRGQLRGELEFKDIEGYLVKKSTVSQLAVDDIVEITGGPFKGMKATITRIDPDKEEATVVLLDASYQLPVTVDANYLKMSSGD